MSAAEKVRAYKKLRHAKRILSFDEVGRMTDLADAAIAALEAENEALRCCGNCQERDVGSDGEATWPVCGLIPKLWRESDWAEDRKQIARKHGFTMTDEWDPDEVQCSDHCHFAISRWTPRPDLGGGE